MKNLVFCFFFSHDSPSTSKICHGLIMPALDKAWCKEGVYFHRENSCSERTETQSLHLERSLSAHLPQHLNMRQNWHFSLFTPSHPSTPAPFLLPSHLLPSSSNNEAYSHFEKSEENTAWCNCENLGISGACIVCGRACSVTSVVSDCSPTDCSPPGSSVHGILQARVLEWVAMASSRGSSWLRDQTWVSCVSCIAGRFLTAESPGKPLSVQYIRAILFGDRGPKMRIDFSRGDTFLPWVTNVLKTSHVWKGKNDWKWLYQFIIKLVIKQQGEFVFLKDKHESKLGYIITKSKMTQFFILLYGSG